MSLRRLRSLACCLLVLIAALALAPATASAAGDGLRQTCYDNIDFTGASVSRVDPQVNFTWGLASCDAAIGVETFSTRWTGNVQPTASGTYTFYTMSDDGVRLWVNGTLVIDNWTDHSTTENSGSIVLNEGAYYDIRLDYYENTGYSDMRLSWLPPGGVKQIIPQSQLSSTQQGAGVPATYFDNLDFTGPTVNRVDPKIDFDWGSGSPHPSIGVEEFSTRWIGSVRAPVSGSYTFHTMSDDGVRLWVDGALIVENWTVHPATENSGTITLSAGQRYEFQLDFYENFGAAVARLSWTPPGGSKEIIPQQNLHPRSPPDAPSALEQYGGDGTTVIADGSWIAQTAVVLEFDVEDPDASQTLTPWVEVVPNGTGFAGSCGTAGSGMHSGEAVSAPVGEEAVTASVAVSGLVPGTQYRWRACAVDQGGRAGPWTEHGGDPDFGISRPPATPALVSPDHGHPEMVVKLDGIEVMRTLVPVTEWTDYSVAIPVAAGAHSLDITYTNDAWWRPYDRNLRLDRVTFTGGSGDVVEAEHMSATPRICSIYDDATASAGKALLMCWPGTASAGISTQAATGLTVRARGDQTVPVMTTDTPTLTARYADPDPGDTGRIEFQVCWNPDCSDVEQSGSSAGGLASGTNGSWKTGRLMRAATFWWRARTVDSSGLTSAYSTTRVFRIGQPPEVPELVEPVAGATLTDTTPRLVATFADPDRAETGSVRFQVCADPSCTAPGDPVAAGSSSHGLASGTDGSWAPSTALAYGTWYWRAQNRDYLGMLSPWSKTSSFVLAATMPGSTVAPAPPGTLAISSPTSGETVSEHPVTVTGIASGGVASRSLTVNGVDVRPGPDGAWRASAKLTSSPATITAVATDAGGKVTTASITVGVQLTTFYGTGGGTLAGNARSNRLEDGAASTRILCGPGGRDVVRAGGGDDAVDCTEPFHTAARHADTIDCGDGHDSVLLDIFDQVNLANCEQVTRVWLGGAARDAFAGSSGRDWFVGQAGTDRITCRGGIDQVTAGSGDDVVRCGDPWGVARSSSDVIECGPGRRDHAFVDYFDRTSGCELLTYELIGTHGLDRLRGTARNELIYGLRGDDPITCGEGRDTAYGGIGDDVISCVDRRPTRSNRDVVECGVGRRDRAVVDRYDIVRGCERVVRL